MVAACKGGEIGPQYTQSVPPYLWLRQNSPGQWLPRGRYQ